MMPDLTLYDPFERMQFNDQHCFLCGTAISEAQRTPVFGEWLQQQFGLKHKELLLLDKSITTYQELTIPCCDSCHTQAVLPLEKEVCAAAAKGIAGFKSLPPQRLFQWICKMYYGTLAAELIREMNPLIKPLYPISEEPQMLGKFRELFKVLQSLRVPMVFSDFLPCSIFLLETSPEEDDMPFAYQDELRTMAFSIKTGAVTVVCKLLDNGIIGRALGKLYQLTADRALHPVQVAEFKARVFYAAYIFNVVPEYFIRTPKPAATHLTLDTLIDDVTSEIFNPWDMTAYTHMLEEMLKPWDIREQHLLKQPGQPPLSFLLDDENRFKPMPHFERSRFL